MTTAWRNAPASVWLAEGPIHPQQQVLRRLDDAYRRFFAKSVGFPSFKRRGEGPGIRFPDPKQFSLDAANGRIKLPKLGWVRLRMSQPVEGALRNVSITREGTKWFASIQVETNNTVPALGVAPTLGVDLAWSRSPPSRTARSSPARRRLGQPPQGGSQARCAAPAHCAPAQRLAAQAHHGPSRCAPRHRA